MRFVWAVLGGAALIAAPACAQSSDPFSFRGVPMHSNEQQFQTLVPNFTCNFTSGLRALRAERYCWATGDSKFYAGAEASLVNVEFLNKALCYVQIEYMAPGPDVIRNVLLTMARYLGQPQVALEHYQNGSQAVVGANSAPPITHYSYRWNGANGYISANERPVKLEIAYTSDACDRARAERKETSAQGYVLQKPKLDAKGVKP